MAVHANMRCAVLFAVMAICFKEFGLAYLRENTQGLRGCGRKGPNA